MAGSKRDLPDTMASPRPARRYAGGCAPSWSPISCNAWVDTRGRGSGAVYRSFSLFFLPRRLNVVETAHQQ